MSEVGSDGISFNEIIALQVEQLPFMPKAVDPYTPRVHSWQPEPQGGYTISPNGEILFGRADYKTRRAKHLGYEAIFAHFHGDPEVAVAPQSVFMVNKFAERGGLQARVAYNQVEQGIVKRWRPVNTIGITNYSLRHSRLLDEGEETRVLDAILEPKRVELLAHLFDISPVEEQIMATADEKAKETARWVAEQEADYTRRKNEARLREFGISSSSNGHSL